MRKGLPQAGNNPLVYGQLYISHIGQMNEICNVKLVGNSDIPLFGFHTNPHQDSETFGFLQSRNSGSLSRKTQNILT